MSELTSLFTNIANAIRNKTGSTGNIMALNFPDAINEIPASEYKVKLQPLSSWGADFNVPELIGSNEFYIFARYFDPPSYSQPYLFTYVNNKTSCVWYYKNSSQYLANIVEGAAFTITTDGNMDIIDGQFTGNPHFGGLYYVIVYK